MYAVVIVFVGLLSWPLLHVGVFAVDWINHLWFANYSATWLFNEGTVPVFITAGSEIGNPFLLFYGSGLYALIAPLVKIFGPDIGVRVAAWLAFLLPALAIARVSRRMSGDAVVGAGMAIVLSASIYQMTNLYARGALTEFFAAQLLTLAIALACDALTAPRDRRAPLRFAVSTVAGLIACLAHPLTFYLAVIFLALPVLCFLLVTVRDLSWKRFGWSFFVTGIAIVPLAVWIGAILRYLRDIPASKQAIRYFPWSIDSAIGRLSPWSMDIRIDAAGVEPVSTPNLSAPVNLMGAAAAIGLAALWWGHSSRPRTVLQGLFLIAAGVFAVAGLAASLPLGLSFPRGPVTAQVFAPSGSIVDIVLGPIQFAYRLVNAVNILLTIFCLGALAFVTRAAVSMRAVFLVAAGFVTCAVAGKVVDTYVQNRFLPAHALHKEAPPNWATVFSSRARQNAAEPSNLDAIPSTQYGIAFFSTPFLFPPVSTTEAAGRSTVTLSLVPGGSSRATGTVDCATPCAIETRILPSPFVEARADGRPINELLRAYRPAGGDGMVRLAAILDAGHHDLTFEFGSPISTAFSISLTVLAGLLWLLTAAFVVYRPRPEAA